MLKIVLPAIEKYDSKENLFFIDKKEQTIYLEHSLLSISKWETKWCKPFLSLDLKTVGTEEIVDYIRCMTVTPNVDDDRYNYLTKDIISQINEYINAPMTATTISVLNKRPNREVITSELIYYWMVAYNIPFECQKWPIKRLLTLIQICDIKNSPNKKMSRQEVLDKQRMLNEQRKAAMQTSG